MAFDNQLSKYSHDASELKAEIKAHLVDRFIHKLSSLSVKDTKSETSSHMSAKDEEEVSISVSIIASSLSKIVVSAQGLAGLQLQVKRFMSWESYSFTISILCIYTFLCLHPYLLVCIPAGSLLVSVLIPGFDARHPLPEHMLPTKLTQASEYDDVMPDLDVELPKPVDKPQNRDSLKKIRELQVSLTNLVRAIEDIENFVKGPGSFMGDERKSTAIFLLAFQAMVLGALGASFVPVHVAVIGFGWSIVFLSHPVVKKRVQTARAKYMEGREKALEEFVEQVEESEVILDLAPEYRQVEIFELQRQGLTPRIWNPWLFTSVVYNDTSYWRTSETRPPGTRFLDDVEPPQGWQFDDQQTWELDCSPKWWVTHRAVRNVELDMDNGWVYDYLKGQRGEWRRRRWVRACFRYHA
jgi:Integral peroxisomal membrane peroxin